jgi:acetate kinase
MDSNLLTINAGSSSLKFAIYRVDDTGSLAAWYRGRIEEIGGRGRMKVWRAPNATDRIDIPFTVASHAEAVQALLDWLKPRPEGQNIVAAGHRVVHGGIHYAEPVRVDAEVLFRLGELIPIDPIHQPHNLAGIQALMRARPGMPQVACFDTAFHRTMPGVAQRFALPRELTESGVRRYGFHGLSYEYIAGVLPEYLGTMAEGRVIALHLGNGASLCAMKGRKSVETTMSFTPLDGLPMGTRCGAIDPAIVLYLMREKGMDVAAVSELLYQRSGLLGISGLSSDMRDLLASSDPHAAEAVEHFAYHVSLAVGALAVSMGGIDALVFTAGIGEHAIEVRERICGKLAWFGIDLDAAANTQHGPMISTMGSRVSAWVIPTDEEQVIARHACSLIQTT